MLSGESFAIGNTTVRLEKEHPGKLFEPDVEVALFFHSVEVGVFEEEEDVLNSVAVVAEGDDRLRLERRCTGGRHFKKIAILCCFKMNDKK